MPDLPIAAIRDGVMITWAAESFRSRATAIVFGLESAWISPPPGAGRLRKAVFYPVAFLRTLAYLRRRRPAFAACLNQPPFLPLACALHGVPTVMDFHSGAIGKRIWRPFRPLYRRLVRQAPFTLVHNRDDAETIRGWGGRPVLTLCLPLGIDRSAEPPPREPTIFVSCSFAEDEPVDILLEAIRLRPEVSFRISGRHERAGLSADAAPGNARFLGFMPYDAYVEEMARATATMTLSTRPHIMQMAVHEALAIGVPVISNRSPALEEALGAAGILRPLTPEAIADGVDVAVTHAKRLRAAALCARAERLEALARELAPLRASHPDLFADGDA